MPDTPSTSQEGSQSGQQPEDRREEASHVSPLGPRPRVAWCARRAGPPPGLGGLDLPAIWGEAIEIVMLDRYPDGAFLDPNVQTSDNEGAALFDGVVIASGAPAGTPSPVPASSTPASSTREMGDSPPAEVLSATEDALLDSESRDAFLVQLFLRERLRRLFAGPWTIADIVAWNAAERFVLLAHDPKQHRLLGRRVSKPHDVPLSELRRSVVETVLQALQKQVTRRKHLYALRHIAELFGDRLTPPEQDELETAVQSFSRGEAPLLVPLVVLRHLGAIHGINALRGQTYMYPSPAELWVRFGA